MANYHETARSNYFRVTNPQVFLAWCEQHHLSHWCTDPTDSEDLRHAIAPRDGDGWPSYDHDADKEIDFAKELAVHLHEGDVAILMSVGAEGGRYVTGCATAVRSNGDTHQITLDDIYEAARQAFGPELTITDCQY